MPRATSTRHRYPGAQRSHRHRPSKATIASDCLTCPPECNFCVISQHDYMVVLAAGAWGLVFKPVCWPPAAFPPARCTFTGTVQCHGVEGPTAEHRGAVPEVRSLISWQVARGHLQQDVDVTGVCGLSPVGQLHLGTGLLGLRILREAISDGVGASERCQSWEGSLVCAWGWHWVSMGLWLGFFFWGSHTCQCPPLGRGQRAQHTQPLGHRCCSLLPVLLLPAVPLCSQPAPLALPGVREGCWWLCA